VRTSEARVLHAALHDQLTGLPNRSLFTQRLAQTLAAPPAPRLAVCLVGLDRFKLINGTLGPAVGDRVLVHVAEQLRTLADEHGCLVARIGGDEFAFLVPDTTCTDDALKFADRALRRIAEPMLLDGRDMPLSASAGVLERAADGGDPEDVMRAVGVALQWAKADGRARCAQFDADRHTGDVARYALSAAMPAGLRNDEFVLFYQPLVDLASGRPVGMEALARWRHPVRGLLGPDEFIGLAESSGLIVGLGLRLLEKACRQAEQWRGRGPGAPFVSVNLAVQQIRDPGLVAQVAAVLDRVGLPPQRLQLEITESAVMSIDDHSLGTLRALRRLGVRLVIDDFGTGYANLSYLCDLPVDGLKLAATFMPALHDDPDCKRSALLEAMVTLGHRVGLSVTAEGVETAAQADRLRRLGCDLAQGWLFGRPVPPEEMFA
jgi:diguanylate cyclase